MTPTTGAAMPSWAARANKLAAGDAAVDPRLDDIVDVVGGRDRSAVELGNQTNHACAPCHKPAMRYRGYALDVPNELRVLDARSLPPNDQTRRGHALGARQMESHVATVPRVNRRPTMPNRTIPDARRRPFPRSMCHGPCGCLRAFRFGSVPWPAATSSTVAPDYNGEPISRFGEPEQVARRSTPLVRRQPSPGSDNASPAAIGWEGSRTEMSGARSSGGHLPSVRYHSRAFHSR